MRTSNKAQSIKPSATIAVSDTAARLKREGKDIISLGAGEPDFTTPVHICQAAIEAIEAGCTKYTPVDGIFELKEAVCAKFTRENELHYTPEQLLVSCGAKQSLFNLLVALLNPGDEAIIPAPYWTSYPDMVTLAEGTPVCITTSAATGYKITPEQLAASITSQSRALILNSPSNPSGQVYSKQELAALAEVLLAHPEIIIISDDIYEHILWSGEGFANIVNACTDLYNRTVVINGVSKAYAMTGWRIGYAAGHADLIKAMKKIQSQSTSNPTSVSQYAATCALNSGTDCIAPMREAFYARHQLVYDAIEKIPSMQMLAAQGAFYAFVDVTEAMAQLGIATDIDFASMLLEKANVAVVPGSAFGISGHVRLSFATSEDLLTQAFDRIAQNI